MPAAPPHHTPLSTPSKHLHLFLLCFQADSSLQLDWDDIEGNTRRRLAGLELEKRRQEEMRRKRQDGPRNDGVNRQDNKIMAIAVGAGPARPGVSKKH